MMKQATLIAASLAALTACEKLESIDGTQASFIAPWQRDLINGQTGFSGEVGRQQGAVTGSSPVGVGRGTIFPGRQPLVRAGDFLDADGNQTVSLTLVDVTIEEAAAAIFGEVLRENYVIDPGVSGRVNIRSADPISRSTAIEVFELALQQNGAALVRRGDIFAIVPLSSAPAVAASTSRQIEPGYTIRVVPLRNIGAQEMAAILQPFAGSGIVGIDAQRNIVVLAGTSGEQRAWQETITSFDVDWLANRSVGIFPIRGRSAQSIINGLDQIVETDENFEPLVVFEAIPENNSILAVAKTPRALENVSVWIQRLTQATQNDAQIYSYDMQYARASEVAPTLASILGVQVESVAATEEQVEVALTETMAAAPEGQQNATRIVASEPTNTLMIHATPVEYDRILGVLHRLDVPPRQVLVEATIVEVTLTDNLRFGVQYLFNDDDGDQIALSSGTDVRNPVPEAGPGFSLTLDASPEVIVDALAGETSVNVISSPNLMILNNESARLIVGDQVPVAVRQAQDVDAADDVFVNSVEFRDTGVIFEVTPRINSSGAVTLDITQEVSSVQGEASATLTPTISQRLIDSSISVDSGETIILGGLFSNSQRAGGTGVPGLRDIPIAGRLFGRSTETNARTELVVLITPRIVNNAMDARRVTAQLRDRVGALRRTAPSLSTSVEVPMLGQSPTPIVEPVAVPAPAPLEPAGVQHHVVLGAFSSQGAAESYWASIASNGPLQGRTPRYFPTGELTTVAIGPMAPAEAEQICSTLRFECFTSSRL